MTRPMTTSEMQLALSDMKICIESQRTENERVWGTVQNFIDQERELRAAQPAPSLRDEDPVKIAKMLQGLQSLQGTSTASPSGGGV